MYMQPHWIYDKYMNIHVCHVQVQLIEVKRHLDTKSKYVMTLQRKGIIKEV